MSRVKKVVLVNSVIGNGSTGKICVDLAKKFEKDGYEVKIAYGRNDCSEENKKYAIKIGNKMNVYWHILMTRLFDKHGFSSVFATKKFIKWLDKYKPDILWLHNLHGYYINVELLFDWIKKQKSLEVRWTLHDCWAFTGHCAHYLYNKCAKWEVINKFNECIENKNCSEKYTRYDELKDDLKYKKSNNQCRNCKFIGNYPKCYFYSNSYSNYIRKMKTFCGVENLTIYTPSEWLKNEIKNSFLNGYEVKVLRNEIDKNIFKPRKSNLREKLHLIDKYVILAVANIWDERKGLIDILKLDKMLNDKYVIIIIGLNRKRIASIKKYEHTHIFPLERTKNQIELAEYYTMADVFINPTFEDNYPTVNLESEACGTRVITYDVGGCKETIHKVDSVLIKPNVNELFKETLINSI